MVGAPSWALSPCDANPRSAFGRRSCCGPLPSEEEEEEEEEEGEGEAFPQQRPSLHGLGAGVLPAVSAAAIASVTRAATAAFRAQWPHC